MEQGLTQRELGRVLGVDPDTVSNWEAGRTSPTLRLLPGIVGYLGLDPRATDGTGGLGSILRQARTAAGQSIEELARKWSLDPTTIWKWEQGRSRPGIRYRAQIREFAGNPAEIGDAGSLGDLLRAHREKCGLRQKDLAVLLGVTQQVVSEWERGLKVPSSTDQDRLKHVVG
jgi:transcriptional regulator with XRE-family HTH domain